MLFKFLHNVKHVLNQERDIIIHVILKKIKQDTKKNIFVFLKYFNVFGFLNNQNNLRKKKQPKTKSKHVHK